jgi:hypothetical protein
MHPKIGDVHILLVSIVAFIQVKKIKTVWS